ncbi:hypothetical protein OE88DRAFT_843475 [Heliocybe sulcata]|uniref:Uncharacterized protein n=1 Tax=Heliocybe sulcata TaxID=5364 RepID=A0A5C3MPT5_9AGAM|nr:hypothetical protein OE88DRAFT_843475 [Heliocybe sulcata]
MTTQETHVRDATRQHTWSDVLLGISIAYHITSCTLLLYPCVASWQCYPSSPFHSDCFQIPEPSRLARPRFNGSSSLGGAVVLFRRPSGMWAAGTTAVTALCPSMPWAGIWAMPG